MSEMWKKIFSLSISGTIVILGISLFCLFFRKKISRRWQYYIWLAAVIRLLLPISGGVNLVGSAFAGRESDRSSRRHRYKFHIRRAKQRDRL